MDSIDRRQLARVMVIIVVMNLIPFAGQIVVGGFGALFGSGISLPALHNPLQSSQEVFGGYATATEYHQAVSREQTLMLASLIGSFVLILGAIELFRRYGREYRSVFDEEYWRDAPDPYLHPAAVARIRSWGKEDLDIPVALLHLASLGALRIVDVPDAQGRAGTYADRAIIRVPGFDVSTLSEIDRKVMRFVFQEVGGGAKSGEDPEHRVVLARMIDEGAFIDLGIPAGMKVNSAEAETSAAASRRRARYATVSRNHETDAVLFTDFARRAERSPNAYHVFDWGIHDAITREAETVDPFEPQGERLQRFFIIAAFIVLALAVTASMFMVRYGLAVLILGVVDCLVLAGLGAFMRRRSTVANEIEAKSAALERWLGDFSKLDEARFDDVEKWGTMLVYAVAFGIADDPLRALAALGPEGSEGHAVGASFRWRDAAEVFARFAAALGASSRKTSREADEDSPEAREAVARRDAAFDPDEYELG